MSRYKKLSSMRLSQVENETVGLFTARQVKNENAVTFSGGILVGVLLVLVGVAIALNTCQAIGEERSSWLKLHPTPVLG